MVAARARIVCPLAACCCMMLRSSESCLPGLSRIWSGVATLPTSCRIAAVPTIDRKLSFKSPGKWPLAQAVRHRIGHALYSQNMIAGGFVAIFRQIGQRHHGSLVRRFQLLIQVEIIERCCNPVAKHIEQIFLVFGQRPRRGKQDYKLMLLLRRNIQHVIRCSKKLRRPAKARCINGASAWLFGHVPVGNQSGILAGATAIKWRW